MTTEVTGIVTIQWAIYHFLLIVCSNNVSVLNSFLTTTSFTVYMTNCDVNKKSFRFH